MPCTHAWPVLFATAFPLHSAHVAHVAGIGCGHALGAGPRCGLPRHRGSYVGFRGALWSNYACRCVAFLRGCCLMPIEGPLISGLEPW